MHGNPLPLAFRWQSGSLTFQALAIALQSMRFLLHSDDKPGPRLCRVALKGSSCAFPNIQTSLATMDDMGVVVALAMLRNLAASVQAHAAGQLDWAHLYREAQLTRTSVEKAIRREMQTRLEHIHRFASCLIMQIHEPQRLQDRLKALSDTTALESLESLLTEMHALTPNTLDAMPSVIAQLRLELQAFTQVSFDHMPPGM